MAQYRERLTPNRADICNAQMCAIDGVASTTRAMKGAIHREILTTNSFGVT